METSCQGREGINIVSFIIPATTLLIPLIRGVILSSTYKKETKKPFEEEAPKTMASERSSFLMLHRITYWLRKQPESRYDFLESVFEKH